MIQKNGFCKIKKLKHKRKGQIEIICKIVDLQAMALVSQPGPRNIQHIKTGAKRYQNCRKDRSKQVKRNIKTYENKIIEDEYSTGDQSS